MSELSDKISGKAKQVAGKLTDNKELEIKGKMEEARGNVKDKLNDAKDSLGNKTDDHKQADEPR